MTDRRRGQASLIAVAIAVVLLAGVTLLSLSIAAGAFDTADREPIERRHAVAAADNLVANSSPLTKAPNAIDRETLTDLPPAKVRRLVPVDETVDVWIRLDDTELLRRGAPERGTTVRRLVLVERVTPVEHAHRLNGSRTTLRYANRSDRLTVDLRGLPDRVETVRINGRTRLHNESGLTGRYTLRVDRQRPPQLTVIGASSLAGHNVTVTAHEWRTSTGILAVTLDV